VHQWLRGAHETGCAARIQAAAQQRKPLRWRNPSIQVCLFRAVAEVRRCLRGAAPARDLPSIWCGEFATNRCAVQPQRVKQKLKYLYEERCMMAGPPPH
jgi:hypothetical protein